MSLDPSLKGSNALVRHRNVLTRAERLERLADVEKWDQSKPVFGLPKVANRKLALAKAGKAEAAEGAAAGAAAPAAGAAAPAGKGAAPAAAGAKAAPAAAAGKAGAAAAKPAAAAAAPKKK